MIFDLYLAISYSKPITPLMYLKNYKVKALYLLPPFLKISFYTIVGLALFRWLFSIYFNLFEINEEYWEFWLPLFLPILPVYIWLNPRVKILIYKNERAEGSLAIIGYFIIVMIGIFLQLYVTTATSDLLVLNKVDQISQYKKVRFYDLGYNPVDVTKSIKYSSMDETFMSKYTSLDMYCLVPFESKTSGNPTIKYWYGLHFHEAISKNYSKAKKNQFYESFIRASNLKFYHYDFYGADHFERIPKSKERENFYIALQQQIKNANDTTNIVLMPIFEPYKNFNTLSFINVFYTYAAGLALFMFFLIFPRYSKRMHSKNPSYHLYIDWFKKVFYIK